MADLSVNVAGVRFNNPLIAASGTFGFGREYGEFYPLSALGGISCKGITLKRRDGNPPPRIAETPSGILNAVGLQNPGVDVFINEDLPWLKEQGTVIIANIAGNTVEEYCEMAEKLSETEYRILGSASLEKTFRLLDLAFRAVETGGLLPAVMSSANEAAVALFLADKIAFFEIAEVVEDAMYSFNNQQIFTAEDVFAADREVRESICAKYGKGI